jgi:hypothetical protein
MRNPKGKTHTKKRVQYDVINKLLIREMRDLQTFQTDVLKT